MTDIVPLDIAPISGGKLSEEMRARIDPQYLTLYDKAIAGKPQVHERPPATFRMPDGKSYIPGQSNPVKVGRIIDMDVPRKYTDPTAPPVNIRVFWPQGKRPEGAGKLPVFIHIHGGGWVLGSKSSELHMATRFCEEARSIVVSVDYRLAPEHPFPACVEDCWEVLQWVIEDGRAEDGGVLRIDVDRVAVGGASAGGHLAATLTHMAISAPYAPKDFKMKFALLTIPAVDFTAGDSASGSKTWNNYPSWTENAFAPGLPAAKLMWYRNMFLPNLQDRHNWHASPIFAPEENFPKLCPTFVTVAELDPLRDEGLAYAKKLQDAGVAVRVKQYARVPHPAVSCDDALDTGAEWVKDLVDALREAFWGS